MWVGDEATSLSLRHCVVVNDHSDISMRLMSSPLAAGCEDCLQCTVQLPVQAHVWFTPSSAVTWARYLYTLREDAAAYLQNCE
jgi:hypothetical protein